MSRGGGEFCDPSGLLVEIKETHLAHGFFSAHHGREGSSILRRILEVLGSEK